MKQMMKGNEAVAAAAIYSGVKCFFGYPITPQTEISAYMAKHLPENGGVFLQAESEISAINMVYGAAGAGFRVMTSSSGPGMSLKQEGISFLAGADLPCVIVNVMRGGPGLGGIQPSQADYFQAVKGGGHGDYSLIVLAPASVREMAEFTVRAFNLADKWRMPVMILSDGILGQMMEAVELDELPAVEHYEKPWAASGRGERKEHNIIKTLYLDPEELERMVFSREERYKEIAREHQDWEEYLCDDAEIVVTAYGITARIARAAVERAREKGIKAGLIRPITLYPFPVKAFENERRAVICAEMSAGQMVEDVRLAVNGRYPVYFYGRTGGMLPDEEEILNCLERAAKGEMV